MKYAIIIVAWLLIIGQPGNVFCDYILFCLYTGTGQSRVFNMDRDGFLSYHYDLTLTDLNEPVQVCFSPNAKWGLVGYDMSQSKPETHITTLLKIGIDRKIYVHETLQNSYGRLVAISPDSKYGVYGQNLNTLKYHSNGTIENIHTDNSYIAGIYGDFSSYNGNIITNSGWPGHEIKEFILLADGRTTITENIVDINPTMALLGLQVSPDGRTCIALSNSESKITSLRINQNGEIILAHEHTEPKSGPVDLGFTPDSKYLLVSFYDCDGSDGGELRCFSIDNESRLSLVKSLDLPNCPHGMAVTPDGKYAVVCDFILGKTYFYVVEISENGGLTYLPDRDFEYPGLMTALSFVPDPKSHLFMLY